VTTVPFHLGRALRVRDLLNRDESLDNVGANGTGERKAEVPAKAYAAPS
jgi:hypothetical protein